MVFDTAISALTITEGGLSIFLGLKILSLALYLITDVIELIQGIRADIYTAG